MDDTTVVELPLSGYVRDLSVSNKRRYLEKISGIQHPCLIPTSELRKNDFPPVTNTDIFNYLVLGHNFCSSQQFKAHKSLDAYKYFLCGFVNYLGAKRFDGKCTAVAKVC